MNKRIERLRSESFEAIPSISIERALLVTDFYKAHYGKYSMPVMRALVFKHLCEQKTIYIGKEELIVGERGPCPKSVSTFPELTCHTEEDLRILNSRAMTSFNISEEDIQTFGEEVVPYWKGRSMRDRVFGHVPDAWKDAYESGLFTEFMEQRAAGHTCLDGTIYHKGMLDFKEEIAQRTAALDYLNDPEAAEKAENLKAMDIACDAAIIFAERHAELADGAARSPAGPRPGCHPRPARSGLDRGLAGRRGCLAGTPGQPLAGRGQAQPALPAPGVPGLSAGALGAAPGCGAAGGVTPRRQDQRQRGPDGGFAGGETQLQDFTEEIIGGLARIFGQRQRRLDRVVQLLLQLVGTVV